MDAVWIGLAAWVGSAVLGAWVAAQKSRSTFEGFALGCLFGPFGVLVEALLPVPRIKSAVPKVRRRRLQDGHPSHRPEAGTEDRASDWLNP